MFGLPKKAVNLFSEAEQEYFMIGLIPQRGLQF